MEGEEDAPPAPPPPPPQKKRRDNRGRKKGQTYYRRTNAQIAADKAREAAARAAEQTASGTDNNFSINLRKRNKPATATSSSGSGSPQEGAAAAAAISSNPGVPVEDSSKKVPFSCDAVPALFRDDVRTAVNAIRLWYKKQSQSWNQHGERRFDISQFPWGQSNDKPWPDPNMLGGPVTFKDFLLGSFANIRIFHPDRLMGHQLKDSRMPCKWHGYSKDCATRSAIFNKDGPYACWETDGRIVYLFSGRFYCKILKEEAEKAPAGTKTNDKHPYSFTGHCPEVLVQLPPNVRSALGLGISRHRALTTNRVDDMIDWWNSRFGSHAIDDTLLNKQKALFAEKKRLFEAMMANLEMAGKVVPTTNKDIDFCDVIPYRIPKRLAKTTAGKAGDDMAASPVLEDVVDPTHNFPPTMPDDNDAHDFQYHLPIPAPPAQEIQYWPIYDTTLFNQETTSRRCLRCGLEKKGATHDGGTTCTAVEYCTSADRQEGWVVPDGYEVGDVRPRASMKAVVSAWKRRKEELSIQDRFKFSGWS